MGLPFNPNVCDWLNLVTCDLTFKVNSNHPFKNAVILEFAGITDTNLVITCDSIKGKHIGRPLHYEHRSPIGTLIEVYEGSGTPHK